mgnify:FL=1
MDYVFGYRLIWGFERTSGDVVIFHSVDAGEGRFLNYGETFSPEITINFVEEGTCGIKVICCIETPSTEIIDIKSINDDGELIIEQEEIEIWNKEYIKSGEITLTYDGGTEEGWV